MVSTHLNNISQIGSFPQLGVKIKTIWNHHLDIVPNGDLPWFTMVRSKKESPEQINLSNPKEITLIDTWIPYGCPGIHLLPRRKP